MQIIQNQHYEHVKKNYHILDVLITWSNNLSIVKDTKIFRTYRRYVVAHETSWCSHESANDIKRALIKKSQRAH